jgi:hypothetical protein
MKNSKGTVSGDNFSLVLELCRQHITTVIGDMNEAKGYEYLSDAEFQIAMMRRINEIRAVTDAYTELFNSVEFTNATV